MSKFCTNCGASMNDNAVFCTSCGAKNDVAPTASNIPSQPAPAAEGATPIDQLKSKTAQAISGFKNSPQRNTYIGIGVVAVAAIVLIVLLFVLLGGGYKGALNDYFDAICDKDGEAYLEATTPEDIIKYLDKEEDYDRDDQESDAKDTVKRKYSGLKEEFGNDIKISYKVTDKDKVDKDDIDDLNDLLEDEYDDLKIKVKAAYELELELKIKGDDDKEDEIEADAYVCKINGDWIVLSLSCKDYSELNC